MMFNEGSKCRLIFGNEINVLTGPQMINSVQLKKNYISTDWRVGRIKIPRPRLPSP